MTLQSAAVTRTSVSVKVHTAGKDGAFVYCGAFRTVPVAGLLLSAIKAQKYVKFAEAPTQILSFDIVGLLPAMEYTLLCTSVTTVGTELTPVAVLKSATSLTTECCRQMYVSLLTTTALSGTLTQNAIAVSVDAPPSSIMFVQFNFVFVNSTGTTAASTYPTSLRFTNSSQIGSASYVAVVAGTVGVQRVTVTAVMAGARPLVHEVVYRTGRTLAVTSVRGVPAVPKIQSAAFSNDGSYVTLTFDSATNKAGYQSSFPCLKLLSFTGASAATCQWADATKIIVYPRYLSSAPTQVLTVGSNFTVLGGNVRAQCTSVDNPADCASWTAVPSASLATAAPAAPVVPTVLMSAPSTVGGCGSLTLDLTNSVGSAGRPWKSLQFKVTGSGDNSVDAASQLETYLLRSYNFSPPSVIPYTAFQKGVVYTIQASLCNFLGACGTAIGTVNALASQAALPVVSILGGSQRSVYRPSQLVVNGDAYTQSCTGAKSYDGLRYSWVVRVRSAVDGTYSATSLQSVSQSQTVFRLPAYSLAVGAQYEVLLTVTSLQSSLSSQAALQVTVSSSQLVAKIGGGSNRYVKVGESTTIDASQSYDEDQQSVTGLATRASFTWSCVQLLPTFSTTCPLAMPAGANVRDQIALSATFTALNTTAQVTVTVSDSSRTSTASVEVTVTQALSAKLAISSALPSLNNINTASQLVLLGSVETFAPCTATWSVDDTSLSLAAISRTPPSRPMVPSAGAGPISFNLVLAADALPQRATLVFSLRCDKIATSVTVTTNGSPLPGALVITPMEGTELSTTFSFFAQQWTDPDLPLTYQFAFESSTSLTNLVIVSKSEFSYATSTLPAGRQDRDYGVNCSLQVFDILSAYTTEVVAVTVKAVSADNKDTALLTLIKSGTGSADSAKNIISVVSTAINAVNCTAVANCSALNRSPCLRTSGECGPCMSGYIGDAGDRSTLCIPIAAAVAANATAVDCETDADCLEWQVCNQQAGKCQAPLKTCSRNCSTNGECLFVDLVTGLLQPSCSLDDPRCESVCSCVAGYSGAFCELNVKLLQTKRAVRSNLIDSLHNLTGTEDINPQSVSAWSASLYSLSIRPYELSVNDVKKVAAIANTTLQNAIALGIESYADIAGVLQATDTAASLLKYNYNPNDYSDANFNVTRNFVNNTAAAIVQTVSTFADLVRNSMVLGQNRTALYYDNFRLSVDLGTVSPGGNNLTLDSPQSEVEVLQRTAPTTVSLSPGTLLNGTTAVAVKLVSVFPRSYSSDTSAFVSNPLVVEIQAHSSDGTAAAPADALSAIEFTFQNNEAQTRFLRDPALNFTTVCTATSPHDEVRTYQCPNSGEILRHNCSRGAGTLVSYCPKPAPTCAVLDRETAVATPTRSCRVVSFNATYTTCSCTLQPVLEANSDSARRGLRGAEMVSRRRLQQTVESDLLDDSGATNVMASSVYIASDFAETFDAADSFTSPADAVRVLVVIIMLGLVWVPGLLVIGVQQVMPKPAKEMKTTTVMQDARQNVLRYVNNVIPRVFTEQGSLLHRVWVEVLEHHVFFRMFTKAELKRRRETICKSLTIFTFMLFLVAAFFDVSSPGNDGSCNNLSTEKACLQRRSPLDSAQTYCEWNDAALDGERPCSYRRQRLSMTELFYLTVLTTILTAIATIPLDYCFGILSAPTANSLKGSKVANAVTAIAAGARRVSNAGIAAVRRVSQATVGAGNSKRRWSVGSMLKAIQGETVMASREVDEEFERASEAARKSLSTVAGNAQALALQQTAVEVRSKARSLRRQHTNFLDKSTGAEESLRSASLTVAGESLQVSTHPVGELITAVLQQRQLMNDAARETKLYDAQWGVITGQAGPAHSFDLRTDAQVCLAEEVEYAMDEAGKLAAILPNYSVHHAGLEVLHLFMVDLLGRRTPAAKIYQQKFGEEFEHSKVVVLAQKYMAGAVLVGLNGFFAYYIMLKAFQKGYEWQIQYLVCCIVQFAVEVLVFETTECVWLNFSVPSFVRNDVVVASEKLTALVNRVAAPSGETQNGKGKVGFFLNAPAHLFASVRLAKAMPLLLESMIVGAYTDHLPGEVCKTWPHYQAHLRAVDPTSQTASDASGEVAVGRLGWVRTVMRGMVLALQAFITIPYSYQRVAIRFVQPMLFSGVSVVWFIAIKSLWSAVAVGSLCALIALFAVREWRRSKRRVTAAVAPAGEAAEDGAAVLIDESSEDEAGYDTDLSEKSLSEDERVDERRVHNNNTEDDGPLHLPASPKAGYGSKPTEEVDAKPEVVVKHTVQVGDDAEGSEYDSDVQPSTPSQWSDGDIFAEYLNSGAGMGSGSIRDDGEADVNEQNEPNEDEESKSNSEHSSVIYDLEQTESGSERSPQQRDEVDAAGAGAHQHKVGKAPSALSSAPAARLPPPSSSGDSFVLSDESVDSEGEDYA